MPKQKILGNMTIGCIPDETADLNRQKKRYKGKLQRKARKLQRKLKRA